MLGSDSTRLGLESNYPSNFLSFLSIARLFAGSLTSHLIVLLGFNGSTRTERVWYGALSFKLTLTDLLRPDRKIESATTDFNARHKGLIFRCPTSNLRASGSPQNDE
jgi:hypothetical protein